MKTLAWKSIALIVFFSVSAHAQLKSISQAEYEKATSTAQKKVATTIRRTVSQEFTFKDSKIDTVRTLTKDTYPNEDSRWMFITKRGEQVIETLQIIYLGKYEFRKEGNAQWTKRCIKDCSASEKEGSRFTIKGNEPSKVQQYLTLSTQFEGKPATLYHYYRVYQLGSTLNFYEHRMWLDMSGLILGEDSTTSDILPSNLRSKESVSYQYEPQDLTPLVAPID